MSFVTASDKTRLCCSRRAVFGGESSTAVTTAAVGGWAGVTVYMAYTVQQQPRWRVQLRQFRVQTRIYLLTAHSTVLLHSLKVLSKEQVAMILPSPEMSHPDTLLS